MDSDKSFKQPRESVSNPENHMKTQPLCAVTRYNDIPTLQIHKRMQAITRCSSVVISMITAIYIATATQAQEFRFEDVLFQTSDQSIWSSGQAFTFRDERFLGTQWEKSKEWHRKIDLPWPVPDIGVGFDASTAGKVGLQSNLALQAGSINASIPVDLSFTTLSDVRPGQTVTLGSHFSFDRLAGFSTFGPRLSYDLDFIFDVAASLKLDPGSFNLGFDVNKQIDIISLNTPTVDTVGRKFLPLPFFPQNSLVSFGAAQILKQPFLDVDLLVTTALGLPPLEGKTKIIHFPIPGTDDDNLGLTYNLLDADATFELRLSEFFVLDGVLPAVLLLEDGTRIAFNLGDNIEFTVPNNIGPVLEVEASLDFEALLRNRTSLDLGLGLDVLVGQFGLILPIISDVNIGPLFKESLDFGGPSFKLFDETFTLGGFNSQTVSFELQLERDRRVPDGGSTLMLLGGPVGGLLLLARRRNVWQASR